MLPVSCSLRIGKEAICQQDKDSHVAEALYLYAAINLPRFVRKIDQNVVDSGHVRVYRSISVIASMIIQTYVHVSNYSNVTQTITYNTQLCINRYCTLRNPPPENSYHVHPGKCPWALAVQRQKSGGGCLRELPGAYQGTFMQ